ncbi:unnamed protein product [Closterium sp. Yama58-4]|nr:unnamed protein product [Closterium sp. Yama58-4]
MDVWGPARVSGQNRERYFLLVVDDYSRHTTVFPLRSKGEVPNVLIPWIRAVRLQLRERFRQDLPVLRLHSDKGGEFSSHLLRDFCRGEGILQSFTLPASPQQNGIAERHIGLVMEVARTSMIHAAAPHFLWSFAVRYAAHQLNLWPRVSLPETLLIVRWTGEVGDASVFRVWGSRAFVRDTSTDKLSFRAIPCVFLGFPTDPLEVTSDTSGPAEDAAAPRRSPRLETPPGFPPRPSLPPLQPVAVHSGAAEGGVARDAASRGAEPEGAEPGGAEPEGAEPGGAEPGGAEPGGAEPEGAEPGGAELEGADSWGAEARGAKPKGTESGGAKPRGTASAGGPTGPSPQHSCRREPLSPQQLREWFARRTRLRSGTVGAGGPTASGIGAGGAGAGGAGAGGSRAAGGAKAGGPRAGGVGAGGAGAGGTGAGGAGAGGAGAGGTRAGGAGAGGTGAGGAGAGGTCAGDVGAVGTGAGGT